MGEKVIQGHEASDDHEQAGATEADESQGCTPRATDARRAEPNDREGNGRIAAIREAIRSWAGAYRRPPCL